MVTLRRYALAIFLAATGLAVTALLYPSLPPMIPMHRDWQGVVDGIAPKAQGAFVLPLLAVVVLVMLVALEPRAARRAPGSMHRAYPQIVAAVQGLLLYITGVHLASCLGAVLDVRTYIFAGVGAALIFLGNLFGKLPRNGIAGIRTPWSLASDEAWSRTQRVGGWLFVLAGMATIAASLLGYAHFGPVIILTAALVSVLYSSRVGRHLDAGQGRGRPLG